jgi:hypothetical protein
MHHAIPLRGYGGGGGGGGPGGHLLYMVYVSLYYSGYKRFKEHLYLTQKNNAK